MKQKTIRVSLKGDKFYDHLAVVKSCDGRSWDAGTKEWVIPMTDENILKLSTIPYLTEKLETEVQRVKLEERTLTEDALKLKNKYPFLYDYQAIGSFHALNKRFYLIADEMGLGKTVQAMPIIDTHTVLGRQVIILAPKSLLPQWQLEIERFIGYKSVIADGTSRKNQRISTYNANMITLSTYESFTGDVKDIDIDWSNVVIIADEASKFKNANTKTWKALKYVRPRVHSFIALTGTPIENSLHNFFNIIQIISPEFMTEREFKSQYCIWERANEYGSKIVGYKSLGAFLKRVAGIMIRRKKVDVAELPELVIQNRIIPLNHEQCNIIRGIRYFAEKHYGSEQAIQALTLLREVADASSLIYRSESNIAVVLRRGKWIPEVISEKNIPKVEEVLGIIEEASEGKIIIFTQFKQMAHLLERELHKANINKVLVLTGDSNQQAREQGVEDFRIGKYDILIATEIFGYGMNLQFADILINFDIPWSPARLTQRIGRIHRIGSTKGKIVVNLIAEDIEEYVYSIVQSKQNLFDQVVDGKAINDESVRKEILQKLIGNDRSKN